jgi:Zn-dependent M16 (insulinase) family peptidase
MFDRLSGIMTFVSYRDPNLVTTLDSFDRSVDFLRSIDMSDSELTKAIIGTIGNIDSYLLPDARGFVATLRHLNGDAEEHRQKMREEVLATSAADFKAFAEVLEGFKREGIVKVLGSLSAIDDSSVQNPGWLNVLKVL